MNTKSLWVGARGVFVRDSKLGSLAPRVDRRHHDHHHHYDHHEHDKVVMNGDNDSLDMRQRDINTQEFNSDTAAGNLDMVDTDVCSGLFSHPMH